MPARTEELQWARVNDFTPGIQQRLMYEGGSVAPGVLGAATEDTFRCIALPGGGLAPLPKKTIAYVPSSYPADPADAVNERLTVSGFLCAGPVFDTPGGTDLTEFHIAYEYKLDSPTNARRYRWQRHQMWEATPTIDTIKSDDSAESNPGWPSARPTPFHIARAHASDATNPGTPIVVGAWFAGSGANTKFWSAFPNPSSPSSVGVDDIYTDKPFELPIGHQGRLMAFRSQGYAHGAAGDLWSMNEELWYTDVNIITLPLTVGQVFVEENPVGYGAVASLNASELLLIKQMHGAVLVRGDVAEPTVIYLPGIPGTRNFRMIGISTPIGFVYGIRDGGVWVWSGGETADLLSPQLDGDFWYNLAQTDNDFLDFAGRFALWDEWIITPKNWLYDYASKSWWRLEDPSVVNIQQWSPSQIENRMYGAVQHITDSADAVVHGWEKNTPANTYKWTSQPLPVSFFREVSVRQLTLIAHGDGTVKVTVKSASGESQNKTFTVSTSAYPTAFRENLRLDGTHLQIILEATGADSGPAPIVYEVGVGFNEDKAHVAVPTS